MTEKAMFGAGCFWHVEDALRKVPGVVDAVVGYSGGPFERPTYEDVCSGKTGHAEVVLVEYDPERISFDRLLEVFWAEHDPTQKNRQGPDVGSQYRSAIFTFTPKQAEAARRSMEALARSGKYRKPVVTEITPAGPFWRAEDYHQQYFKKRGLSDCRF